MMKMNRPREARLIKAAPGRRSAILLMALAALIVLISFAFWHDVWFGRRLRDREIGQYLNDTENPRKIQHALSQIADRIIKGDSTVKQWYPQILAASQHPKTEIRVTAAWVMGQDARWVEFHQSLLRLLADPELMVRRNAALALVRFGDASGRAEIVKMLQPHSISAPGGGKVSIQLKVDQPIITGALVARIRQADNREIEVRPPFSGKVQSVSVSDGSMVAAGDPLMLIEPEEGQVWEALRGLYFVGQPGDLAVVRRYVEGVPELSERIRQQAALTAQAIRTRAEQHSTH